jgi:hypothetical protein
MPEDIAKINDVIYELLDNSEKYHKEIDCIRREERYNYGFAAEAGAKYLLSRLVKKKRRND